MLSLIFRPRVDAAAAMAARRLGSDAVGQGVRDGQAFVRGQQHTFQFRNRVAQPFEGRLQRFAFCHARLFLHNIRSLSMDRNIGKKL